MNARRLTGITRTLVIAVALGGAIPRASAAGAASDPVGRGIRFLEDLYSPEMRLLPEYDGARTWWLYHDNYLAAHTLRDTHPEIARAIRARIAELGVTESGKIEILFGESRAPLPFRLYELEVVEKTDNGEVKTERVLEEEFKGWEEYADLRFMAAMALKDSDAEAAKANMAAGMAMWDGIGFADRVLPVNGRYATYKLALALLAADRLGIDLAEADAIRERLLALQSDSGGWITDYTADLAPVGLANVETTCMAILALRATTATGARHKVE